MSITARRRPLRVALLTMVATMTSGCALLGMTRTTPVMPNGPGPARLLPVSGWTAMPTASDPAFLTEGLAECIEEDGGPDPATASVLQDQRGPNGAAIIWVGSSMEACVLLRGADGSIVARSLSREPWAPPSGGMWIVLDETDLFQQVGGSVGPGTARVTVDTASGQLIEASVGDGLFLAWWPGDDPWTNIEALDVDGGMIQGIEPTGGTGRPASVTPPSSPASPTP